MQKHDMRDHRTVDEIIRNTTHWEDADSDIIVCTTEDGKISVRDPDGHEEFEADTLLEALYLLHPNCYCQEHVS